MTHEIVLSPCNSCGQETEHDVIWQHTHRKLVASENMNVKTVIRSSAVCCRGCKELAFREESWFALDIEEEDPRSNPNRIKYRPARLWHRPPHWLDTLEEIDKDLKGLLDEIYASCNDDQVRLLSMGVRSALDHVMTLILGGDVGAFEQKLDQMVQKQHLTQVQSDNIRVVIDAGSASTHRGFKPPRPLIEEMVVVMEGLIRQHYITGPMLQTAKQRIPPRPPRLRESNS